MARPRVHRPFVPAVCCICTVEPTGDILQVLECRKPVGLVQLCEVSAQIIGVVVDPKQCYSGAHGAVKLCLHSPVTIKHTGIEHCEQDLHTLLVVNLAEVWWCTSPHFARAMAQGGLVLAKVRPPVSREDSTKLRPARMPEG